MLLRILGANGTYPTRGRPASGYLVTGGGATVLVDAGGGVAMALHELMDPADLDAIVVTHGHPDHSVDVLAIHNALRFGPAHRRDLPLIAPGDAVDRLASFLGAGPDHAFFEVFDVRPVVGGDTVSVGGLRLTFGTAVHPVPALSVRFDEEEASIAYSGDTGPGGDLAALAAGAGLLLCEASLQGEPAAGRYPYHLFASEAGEIAEAAGVARLVITHVTPTLDSERSAVQARSRYAGPVVVASPGLELEV